MTLDILMYIFDIFEHFLKHKVLKDVEYRLHHRLSKFDWCEFLNLKPISFSFFGIYMAWFLSRIYWSSLDHDLMASIWGKAISLLARNLNSGRSYCTYYSCKEVFQSMDMNLFRFKLWTTNLSVHIFVTTYLDFNACSVFTSYAYCMAFTWVSARVLYTQYPIIRNSAEFLGKFKRRALGRSNLRNGQCSDFQS